MLCNNIYNYYVIICNSKEVKKLNKNIHYDNMDIISNRKLNVDTNNTIARTAINITTNREKKSQGRNFNTIENLIQDALEYYDIASEKYDDFFGSIKYIKLVILACVC